MSKELTLDEAKMAYFGGLSITRDSVSAEMANNIPTENGFSLLAQEFVDTTARILAPLDRISKRIMPPNFALPPDVRPVINVEVITGAGDALKNPTEWCQSNLTAKTVPVQTDLYVVPFALTEYDLMNGREVRRKVGAAVNALAQSVMQAALAVLKAADTDNVIATGGEEVSPEFIARRVSTIFGGKGRPDSLLVSPSVFGGIIPTNALSLDPEREGVYGIGRIYETDYIEQAGQDGENVVAVALKNDALLMAASVPPYRDNRVMQVVSLQNEYGIPMVLTSWFDPCSRTYANSVETLVGFAVSDATRIATVNATSAPES